MSIQSEIERIQSNISAAYDAVEEKGGSLPEGKNSDNLPNAIAGIPTGGGKEYAAGDGITIEDDTISVKNPNQGILTQEEFEQLPDEKKNKGTWVVLDDADTDAMANANIYSTEEIVCGRWIDGRPLYRKTFVFKLTATVDTLITPMATINADKIVNAYGLTGSVIFPSNVSNVSFSQTGIFLLAGAQQCLGDSYISIEYTKTTDAPTIDISGLMSAKTATSTPSVQKSGKVTHDGVEYDYELPNISLAYASASSSSADFKM